MGKGHYKTNTVIWHWQMFVLAWHLHQSLHDSCLSPLPHHQDGLKHRCLACYPYGFCIPQLTSLGQESRVAGRQCWWLLQHTPSFSAVPEGLRWENKQTNKKPPDKMAAERKELWPDIYHSWKPTPCPHPKSSGNNAQARRIAVATTAHALPPSFLLFRHHREWPVRKSRNWGQFVSQVAQKLHSILSSHTIQKRNMDKPRHLGAMRIKPWKDWDPLLPGKALQEPHTANNPYSFLSKSKGKTISSNRFARCIRNGSLKRTK